MKKKIKLICQNLKLLKNISNLDRTTKVALFYGLLKLISKYLSTEIVEKSVI